MAHKMGVSAKAGLGSISRNRSSLIQLENGMQEIKLNNCERTKRWEWERIQAKLFKLSISSTRVQQWQEGGSTLM